jgi:hypothetical protein
MLHPEHYRTWLIIWSCSLRILADTPAVLSEGLHRYTQLLKQRLWQYLQYATTVSYLIVSNLSSTILPLDVTYCSNQVESQYTSLERKWNSMCLNEKHVCILYVCMYVSHKSAASHSAYVICLHAYCHAVWSDCRQRFRLDIGFLDHLCTLLGTTSNYSVIADFHTVQAFSRLQCLH